MKIFQDTDISKILEIEEHVIAKEMPYWTSEIYGFGKYIRQYGFYPLKLPLILFTDHSGPSIINKFNHFEIDTDAPVVMFHSPELVKKWRNEYKKSCYNLYSPYVFYRRKNKINIDSNAKGTIAYPAHTIPELDEVSNIENYIHQLKSLPEKFQPVSVSIHYHDLNKGLHKIFLKHGIPVYTAGNPNDYRFTEKFYAVLRNFKYATSNLVGSYLFYAVEMNIPFFLYGEEPVYQKNTDSRLAEEALESVNTKDEMLDRFIKTFGSVTDEISFEQKKLVETTLGINDGISRIKMSQILYFNFLKYLLRKGINKAKRTISKKQVYEKSR